MGRELQKKKNRSSISKVRQKPKSKKRMLANSIIAKNWDRSQTLSQNYKRLGLTARLNKNTGGVEKKLSDVLRDADGRDAQNQRDGLTIANMHKRGEKLDVTEAKIERDPETGKILRVIEEDAAKANPLNDPLNELNSESEDEVFSLRNQHGNTLPSTGSKKKNDAQKTETVRQLEEQASRPAAKHQRRQPEGERAFVEELVRTYGDDYGKMARDTKINYMQRSEGDLKRRIKKWRENGGTVS